jgi:acyl dehydratase
MIDQAHIGRTWPPFETLVEAGRLRTYAKAIGEIDPIHVDETAAKAAGYRDIVAPPTFAFCLGFDEPDQMRYLADLAIPIDRMLHGEQRIVHHDVICAGDRLRCVRRVGDIYAKRGGALEFVIFETDVRRADTSAPVAELAAVLVVRNP